ncbi:hypothetical protein MUK42_00963 [Musa troglodytarum]|uniref:Uncharacterized protein n=1 Tax=Musa troglodytarum TaxID=320322 RepID=A0A9E7JUW2_9LILI|nr:hypothetical protein MUK42_00963 [Musa troglodytarum]
MEEEGGGKARPSEEDEEATSTMEARPSEQEQVPYVICSPSSPSSFSSSVSPLFCFLFSWERRRIRQEVTRIVQFLGETSTPPSVSTFIGSIRLGDLIFCFAFSVSPEANEIDAAEYEEKHQRYEALYSRRLRAKYFSKKALDGGDIYGDETTIDNEIIKSSRWPCTRSFADPIKYMEHQKQSSSEAETNATTDKNQEPKKSC